MAAKQQDFEMWSGDSAVITVTVKDAAGVVVSLIGATSIRWWVGVSATAKTPKVQKSVGSGIVVTNPGGGVLTITLDPADTTALKGADYYHELEVVDSLGRVQTCMYGTLTLHDDLVV